MLYQPKKRFAGHTCSIIRSRPFDISTIRGNLYLKRGKYEKDCLFSSFKRWRFIKAFQNLNPFFKLIKNCNLLWWDYKLVFTENFSLLKHSSFTLTNKQSEAWRICRIPQFKYEDIRGFYVPRIYILFHFFKIFFSEWKLWTTCYVLAVFFK